MKNQGIDCVHCAFETVKAGQGSYCNAFEQATKFKNDYKISSEQRAFRLNPECSRFTLLESMRTQFKRMNGGEDWYGTSSPVELKG